MKFRLVMLTTIALTSILVLAKCNNTTLNEVKFNKSLWDSVGDLESHPGREYMLEDLTKHHQINGLTYHQLIDSLGQPDNYNIKDSLRYDIVINYGYLDPKSGTYLAIGFNKDSIMTGFEVVKWHNRHVNE